MREITATALAVLCLHNGHGGQGATAHGREGQPVRRTVRIDLVQARPRHVDAWRTLYPIDTWHAIYVRLLYVLLHLLYQFYITSMHFI